MNTTLFKHLVKLSSLNNLKTALYELGDNETSDRIGFMLADENEILTRRNIHQGKLIKLIEQEYETCRNIVIKNIYNIDNFTGRIQVNISYDKVKYSKIENDTKESEDLQNYSNDEYKYPVVMDTGLTSYASVSFLEYNGNAKDIFDYT